MEDFGLEAVDQFLDHLFLFGRKLREFAQGPLEFLAGDFLDQRSQFLDGSGRGGRAAELDIVGHAGADQGAGLCDLGFELDLVFLDDFREVVNVLEINLLELSDFGGDIAREPQVQDEQGQEPSLPGQAGLDDVGGSQDGLVRGGAGDDNVGLGEHALDIIEGGDLGGGALRLPSHGALGRAGDKTDLFHAAVLQQLEGQFGDLAGADHEHIGFFEFPENGLGEFKGHGRDRGLLGEQRGLGMDLLDGLEGFLEEEIKRGGGEPLCARLFIGAADLAGHLGLAQDEGIESRGNFHQMSGGLFPMKAVGQDRELGQGFEIQRGKGAEEFHGINGFFRGPVELGAVAG